MEKVTRIRKASQKAHMTTEGRQALTLLGVNRLWPVTAEELVAVFEIAKQGRPASNEFASKTPDDQ